ncbi:MAG: hypothetical protein KME54_17565 [Tolypothrix brevis GSE-NOS-MK-07-07A]|jgi:hypothetical protein|nr:hypothetical protein [Tolypothrix brevis GSE-NOS-MK-07-07A]
MVLGLIFPMSRLAKLRSKFSNHSESTFNEAEVRRDSKGKFAPKDAAKQIASKTKRTKKVSDLDKDFDTLVEEVFQERFKRYKEDGSYKYMILGNGKQYDDIVASHGKEAADKAFEDHIRKSASGIAKELKKRAVLEETRTGILKGKDKQLKRELAAMDKFYPRLRYQETLYEFKSKNPNANLLERLEAEEKLDKQLSYNGTMQRGAKLTKKLDTKMSKAKTEDEKLTIMEGHRNELIKNGMPRQDAIDLVETKDFDNSVKSMGKSVTQTAAAEFYQIARGYGSSTLRTFKRDTDRAYANKQEKTINIGVFPDKHTIYHEMGHHVEFEDPRIAAAAREWRDKRATGEEQSLNSLVEYGTFREDEKAKPDKYISPYVGKVYRDGSTEVISMGIQHFHSKESMLEFYEQDREHYQFIMGVARRD